MLSTVGFVTNNEKQVAIDCASRAEAFFRRNGIRVLRAGSGGFPEKPDLMITFGGDGTLLSGARLAMAWGSPLLGINLGTVGFLTEEEPENLDRTLEALRAGQYTIEKRSLLEAIREGNGGRFFALNDVVITRGGYARLIRVEAEVNGEAYGAFTADGIIVATPTGSTGYSLSAGGPIVEPGMSCMTITPVCAHSLQHAPCVVASSSEILLRMRPDREQTAELQVDGMNRGTLGAGDEVRITGAQQSLSLIRLRPYHFFGLVRKKLMEWGSTHE